MVVVDAVVRLLPGAVGGEQTLDEESFNEGLLEYPHYTRPRDFRGMEAPEVLVSGHHKNVAAWRRAEALKRTWQRRPDLIRANPKLLEELRQVLAERRAGGAGRAGCVIGRDGIHGYNGLLEVRVSEIVWRGVP